MLKISQFLFVTTFIFLTTSASAQQSPDSTLQAPLDVAFDFIACGAMGDAENPDNAKLTEGVEERTRPNDSDGSSIKFEYKHKGNVNWAGWYWLYPEKPQCNWGFQPGTKIENATKVTFYATGANGDEVVRFFIGGVTISGVRGQQYEDNFKETIQVRLTNNWQQYTIPIPTPKKNLESVLGAYGFSVNKPMNFYIDEIRYE